MNKILPLLVLLIFGFANPAKAAEIKPRTVSSAPAGGRFGLGAIFGSPTALSAKLRNFNHGSLDFGLAFSFNDSFLFYSDYLHEFPGGFGNDEFFAECTPYFGFGGIIAFTQKENSKNDAIRGKKKGDVGAALRLPLGFEWNPHRTPLGVFLEIAPAISIIPETSGFFFAGLGVRYYF